ncbi:hypothetical protein J2Y58_002862 [Sphingomonas sp. BE138]|uniref:hypothetical protein n=1 Tax=Sphingomonas sp. BE138 TaxID=2817845 RepID=UPI00285E098F|nr:hypothetical protein [Sphingomonas sp. BE138]MDR6789489.1 hypothetical protein [Sphingomonas sp. BE138]
MTRRHPAMRMTQLALGGLLLLLAAVIAPLPGPGGVFPFAGGMLLILRNSARARGWFARAKRRWPRIGHAVDVAMRRRSALRRQALRRRARDRAAVR